MDGLDDPTETYPLLSGAAGFAYRAEQPGDPSPGAAGSAYRDEAAQPVDRSLDSAGGRSGPTRPTSDAAAARPDEEPPTEEFDVVPDARTEPSTGGLRLKVLAVAGVAVLVGVAALVISTSSTPATSVGSSGPAFAAGTFDLASNVTELNLTLGRPADSPIRVSTPTGSALNPAATVDGTDVRLTTRPTGSEGDGRLDVQLDDRIAWTIRMNGGVRAATFVLTGGTVREVDLSGGADRVHLTLPGSDQPLPIRMSGGVREWSIDTEGEVPVRVQARSGAGEVSLYGKRERGIAQNTVLTTGDGSGLDVTAAAGFGSLAITSR
ncbi:hypothetical protein OWR29_02080 [Actinoplanes sp. Pm04-4]|uniref:Adhesin domain-containing protein n=1 Tax=Paractinoplanes pyxinae TaxID=2997416 RepID=A0ABT4AR96_9ACTN|nr:hypothetical protein [Actinoplanes pyxinae]MCY1136769.1 hypothetical protein [Actinoplanes pyxinae]